MGAGVSALGAGMGLVGLAGGGVSGAIYAFLNGTNVAEGLLVGSVSGWISGGISQYVGGGVGAFTSGVISNGIKQIPSLLKGERFDFTQMILSGIFSTGLYYGSSYINWAYRGGNKIGGIDVSFRQFCQMQTLFQRSRASHLEMGGYLMDDGTFQKISNGTNISIDMGDYLPEGSLAEFHTHWDKPGKLVTYDKYGNYVYDRDCGYYVSRITRYHGYDDLNTNGLPSIVYNMYDASYYKGGWWDYKTIGPRPYVDIIDPHILRYNFGFLF